MNSMKPFRTSISLVILNDDQQVLIVKRPDDPDDMLRNLWGLPAVTVSPGETLTEAAQRVGLTKLGVKVKVGRKIGESTKDRGKYTLRLIDYDARIVDGQPVVPQVGGAVTQYVEVRFVDDPTILIPAAQHGSQCTEIYLDYLGIDWQMVPSGVSEP